MHAIHGRSRCVIYNLRWRTRAVAREIQRATFQGVAIPRRAFQLLRDLPRLKYIVQSEQPEIIHAHMVTNAVLMRLGRSLAGFGNYGLVTTIHNEWRLTSHLMRAGDRVIVLSDHGKKTFINRGFPDHKLRIVPHGILHSPRRLSEVQHEQVAPAVLDR